MDFFGPSLLKVSKEKRKKGSGTDNDTQSSEDERSKADKYSESNELLKAPPYPDLEINKQVHENRMISPRGSHPGRYIVNFSLPKKPSSFCLHG